MKEDSVLYRRDAEMRTALSYIAYDHSNKLQNDILFKLIWKLINVDQKAISYCIEEGNAKYFDLMKTQCNQNHIHAALKYNFPRAIEYYLGKDTSQLDDKGNTVLMSCAEYGFGKYMDLFSDQMGHQNKYGQTALILCVKNKADYEPLRDDLIQKEAGIVDYFGRTALDYAVLLHKTEFIGKLRQYEWNAVDFLGRNSI